MESYTHAHESKEMGDLLPLLLQWASEKESEILMYGEPLSPEEKELAAMAGVCEVDKVRVLEVDMMTAPNDAQVCEAAAVAGFDFSEMEGLTLGHGILIKKEDRTKTLMIHELRHVHQVEQFGSLQEFLRQYIYEL